MVTAAPVTDTARSEALRVIDISRVAGPLRFVALGRYVLLIISIQAVISCAETLITDRKDAAAVVTSLIGLAVFGFCAWAGWKSIGVLNSILYSKTLWAYLLLSGVGGFLLLAGAANLLLERGKVLDNEKQFLDVVLSIWTGFFLTFTSSAALRATSVVRNRKLPGLDMRFGEFLRKSLAFYEKGAINRLPPAEPKRGILFLGAGAIALFAFSAVPIEFFVKYHLAQSMDYIRAFIFALLIYARQCFRPTFESVMDADHRPPVLFLRSFADDEKLEYKSGDKSLFDFSLESRLADHFQGLGPFIAVGDPKDKTPHLGAARVQLSDEAWQGSVLDWIAHSRLIIIMAGATHWIGWEIKKVIETGAAERALILFPQTKRRWLRKGKTVKPEERLEVVQSAFADTPWEAGLRGLTEAAKIRSIIFEPEGRVTAILSKPKNRDSYHLAALIAHYLTRVHELGPATAPVAVVAPESKRLASVGARGVAVAIDTLVFVCLYALGLTSFPYVLGTWWAAALGVVAFLVGCSALERWTGATLGKSILGLKVEMAGAGRDKTLACFTRNGLRLLDGIGFYLPAFVIALNQPLRQRFGDQVAGTIVVRSKPRAWVRVALVFAFLIPLVLCVSQASTIVSAIGISMVPFHPVAKDVVTSSSGRLSVGNFQYVDGDNRHEPDYKPGESVGFQYEIAGFNRDAADAADVSAETTLIDPYGLRVTEPKKTDFHETISKVDRIRMSLSFPLPDYAPRGTYFVDIKLHDRTAGSAMELKPAFNVETDPVPEAYAPVIRKFQLSTSKDSFGDHPLVVEVPARIYMRAVIYGLPLHNGRENAVVSEVLRDSSNRTIWYDPRLVSLSDAYSYYPPTAGVIVTGALDLKAGFEKGVYTETYMVKDVSGQSATRSVSFEVR